MTNYFDFNDLKTAIIGIVGGVITFFICLGLQRYWSNRNVKNLKLRIEEKEAYKARLDNLARSDRALLITGFQAVLTVLACICGIVAIQIFLLFWEMLLLTTLVYVLLWLLPILLCVGIVKMLEDIQNHPQSLDIIEKRITELKNKLLRQNK
jgi:hypothetical protein